MAKPKARGRRKWLTHLGMGALFGLFFGLLGGYWACRYYVGHFSAVAYLWSFVFSFAISYSISGFCAITEALLRPRLEKLPRPKRLWLEVPASTLAHLLGFLVPAFLFFRLLGFPFKGLSRPFVVFLAFFVLIYELEYLAKFYRELKEAEVREERLKALAAKAELRALRAQINPHFLFNTLNTIASLIGSDPRKAEEVTEKLAEVFRYVLLASEREFVTLGEELEFIEDYLDIEKARFGERLQVERDVSPSVLETPVPALILQPLVENVLRHGQGTDGSVDLSIRAQPQGDEVMITIADRGPGMSGRAWECRGYGLRNVNERLRRTYGHEYGLEIRSNEPKGTTVTVRIPTQRR